MFSPLPQPPDYLRIQAYTTMPNQSCYFMSSPADPPRRDVQRPKREGARKPPMGSRQRVRCLGTGRQSSETRCCRVACPMSCQAWRPHSVLRSLSLLDSLALIFNTGTAFAAETTATLQALQGASLPVGGTAGTSAVPSFGRFQSQPLNQPSRVRRNSKRSSN